MEDQRRQLVAYAFLPVRWLQGGKGPKHAKVETMEGLVGKGLLGSNSLFQFKLEPTSLGHAAGICTGEGVVSSPDKGAASAEECEVLGCLMSFLKPRIVRQSVRHRVSILDGERFLF